MRTDFSEQPINLLKNLSLRAAAEIKQKRKKPEEEKKNCLHCGGYVVRGLPLCASCEGEVYQKLFSQLQNIIKEIGYDGQSIFQLFQEILIMQKANLSRTESQNYKQAELEICTALQEFGLRQEDIDNFRVRLKSMLRKRI